MEENFLEITEMLGKINGCYEEWFQKSGANFFQVQVAFSIIAGATTQDEICKKFKMPKQTVNKVIKDFQRNNYLTLETEEIDSRRKKILLTESGKDFIEKISEPLINFDRKVFNRIGKRNFQKLLAGMTAYEKALREELEVMK